MVKRRVCSGVAIALLTCSAFTRDARAQPEMPEAISFFAPFFLPKVLQDDYRLKEYVTGEEFSRLRKEKGDPAGVDALFVRAQDLCWGNTYEALLLCFVATMEHRNFGVRLPVVGPLLWLPLTSEFPDDFHRRVRALPSLLYADTPREGDRDKLQHFFGSALLTYVGESRDPAERVGTFVEWGEDRFVIDGALDNRDLRANRQGQNFGLWLLADPTIKPSFFLRPVRPDSLFPAAPDTTIHSEFRNPEER
jgi:hypothetical protein